MLRTLRAMFITLSYRAIPPQYLNGPTPCHSDDVGPDLIRNLLEEFIKNSGQREERDVFDAFTISDHQVDYKKML